MRRGFSLIELLVVVAIIAILVGVATPYYSDYVKESKRAKALQDLDVLKQAVVLFNSQEDLPYQGQLATTSPYLPLLGENDFNGLQGRYLTYIPVDPWGKNYKLDPYACYVYSEGADSRVESDDIREYYVKDLALTKVEWEDRNNNRSLDQGDWLYFNFNKSLWISAFSSADFDIYENSEVSTATLVCNLETDFLTRYTNETQASTSVIITEIGPGTTIKLGVHSLAIKDELATLKKYQEVQCDRKNSNSLVLRTRVERNNTTGDPLRYAVRTNPIKVTPR